MAEGGWATAEGGWTRVPRDQITVNGSVVTLRPKSVEHGQGTPGVSAVRYAWTDYVDCVLANSDGLPAGPFVVNVTTHETAEDETAKHETAKDETAKHETAKHETAKDETAKDETAKHETAKHETAKVRYCDWLVV